MASVRKKRRRRRSKGRFSFLLKGLTIIAVFVAMTMGATVFFQLEQVAVLGNQRYTPQEIERVSGLKQGDNLFRINKYEIEQEILQALPYVKDVDISRRLPSTIQIEIKEWDAAALISASGYAGAADEPEQESVPESDGVPEENTAEPEESPTEAPNTDETVEPEKDAEPGEEASENLGEEPGDEADARPGNLWLMSVGGRLLEPAKPDSPGILIKGLSALSPKAGTQLAVSQSQQDKLNALLQLMAALEERGSIQRVSEIDLSAAAEIYLSYDGRFLVKLPMAGDFSYCLHALEKVVEQRAANETGTMDLTRKDYAVVYSPT